ncbi:hypothetical protein BDV93DRAFT_524563, partial [Ceratobasidium sp. AG-I]
MSNLHGALFALRALVKPSLIIPGIKVDTIARLDFAALRNAGYTGAVFDRDNCLTYPHRDIVIPEIADAWTKCKATFGPENVVIVSNSAGTRDDPLGIQMESLSYHLGVPVLRHGVKKPACGKEILHYFRQRQLSNVSPLSSASPPTFDSVIPFSHLPDLNEPLNLRPPLPTPPSLLGSTTESAPSISRGSLSTPRLLVVGDRLSTDVLLASTIPYALGIWTTRLWAPGDLRVLRFFEQTYLRTLLYFRGQTFRHGVLEDRAPGENWLGKEGWFEKSRRIVLGAWRRVPVERAPIPPRRNDLAKFVLPEVVQVIGPPPLPTTRAGWAWYYSKIGGRYAARGMWWGLVWSWVNGLRTAKRGLAWGVTHIKEARARRIHERASAQVKE